MQNYTVRKELKINVSLFVCHLHDIHIYEHPKHGIHLLILNKKYNMDSYFVEILPRKTYNTRPVSCIFEQL